MPRQAPLKVRTEAFKFYTTGMSVKDIVASLAKKFPDEPVSDQTVYSWKRRYNWADRKTSVEEKALAKVEESQVDRLAKDDIEQQKMYKRIASKGAAELEDLTFTRASDAVKAMDIGIQGQRGIAKGLVNVAFLEQILLILQEEIKDEALWDRLKIRFATLQQSQVDG